MIICDMKNTQIACAPVIPHPAFRSALRAPIPLSGNTALGIPNFYEAADRADAGRQRGPLISYLFVFI